MKKIIAIILACVMACGLITACGSSSSSASDTAQKSEAAAPAAEEKSETAEAEGENLKIGMTAILYSLPFFQSVAKGVEDSLREGDTLTVYDFQADVSTMVSNMEDIIAKQCDVMIYDGFDQDAIKAPLEQAKEAGVVCFNYDFPASSDNTVSSIVSDDYGLGYEAGQYLAKLFNEKGTFGEVFSADSVTTSSEYARAKGFEDAIAEYPEMEIVVNIYPTANASDAAMDAMASALQAHPDLDGFFSISEWATIGVVQAADAAEKELAIVAVDVSETLLGYLKDGKIVACEDQQAYVFGQMIAQTMYDYLDGKEVESTVTVPIKIVDKDNMDEYLD